MTYSFLGTQNATFPQPAARSEHYDAPGINGKTSFPYYSIQIGRLLFFGLIWGNFEGFRNWLEP